MNPIGIIKFGKEYRSGPKVTTEFHAGGIFFCVPFEDVIIFFENGTVEVSKRVIERFRPMDAYIGQTVPLISEQTMPLVSVETVPLVLV